MTRESKTASLAQEYRIAGTSLRLRREFMEFSTADVRTLAQLAGWAEAVAGPLVREFYEHQFQFGPTRRFFEAQAQRKGVSLDALRAQLEKSQAGYFREIFAEARAGGEYGVAYFEKRLFVGKLHNVIDLPLKWYVGSYSLYQRLVRKYLRRRYLHRPGLRARAEQAIFTVFNFDIQAVTDAFFYDYLQSIGLDLTAIEVEGEERDLSDYYKVLKASVRETLEESAKTTALLSRISAQLGERTANAGMAVQQVADAVQQIAGGADETSRATQQLLLTSSEMADGIVSVAASAGAVVEASTQTRATAERGADSIRSTVAGMKEIQTVVAQAAGRVSDLGQLSERIGAVVSTIDDIAEQTNLLALNAAIEAARAGEHGRGFAVVAEEVRKLAERSQRETKSIGELIAQVQDGTRDAVSAMAAGSERVGAEASQADLAGASLVEILEAVELTVSQISGIAAAAQQMAAQSQSTTSDIQSIAAVAQENSAATEEVLASSEQMAGQMHDMASQAEQLTQAARRLHALTGRFSLGDVTGQVTDSGQRPPLRRIA